LIDGVVQDCPALLLEPSRENKAKRSEQFDDSYWVKLNSSIEDNQIVSPDGNQTADKYTHGGSNAVNYVYGNAGLVTSGNYYTFSVFVKKGTGNFVQLLFGSGAFGVMHQNFDIDNGVIGSSSGDATPFIEEYPNGWYRIGITDNCTTTQTAGTAFVSLAQSNTSSRLNPFTSSDDFYVWGAQVEEGSYATSYIPTTTSTVTRNADVCNGAGTSAEFNDSEGVLFAELKGLNETDSSTGYITLNDGSTTTNAIFIQYRNTGELRLYNGGTSTPELIYRDANADLTKNIKLAIKYGTTTGSYKVYINGFSQTIEGAFVATAMSGLSKLQFAYSNATSNPFRGKTKQLMVFNEALTDSELEQVTSWTSFGEMAKGQLYTIE